MRILVTGATGQLGYDVCRVLETRGIEHRGVSSQDVDITDGDALGELIQRYRPDTVIHCAAYTKVDLAEDERDLCMLVNVEGTRNVALACVTVGAKLAFLSTDYVFPGEGDRPFETGDRTGPRNVYGKSKLAAEQLIREMMENYFIIRISWVFGNNGNNFIRTMLKLGQTRREVSVVGDQIGSPTYTVDLAPLLCDIVQSGRYGTYHASNEGFCSWADLAERIFEQAGMGVAVKRVSTAEYPAKAARPLNSRLSKASLEAAGFARLPDWHDALERYLKELGKTK